MAQSVSAVLLSLNGAAGFGLEMKYNKQGNQATLAWPVVATLASFFKKWDGFGSARNYFLLDWLCGFFDSRLHHATINA